MDQTMAWSKVSKSDPLGEVMSLIDDAVSAFRNRGVARSIATEQAALALGITPRRARALLYGEAFRVTDEEHRMIRAAYMRHLDDEAAHFAARLEAAKARRRQLALDLE